MARHCGIAEQFATKDAEQAQALLRTKRPKWCLQGKLRQFTDNQLRQYIADACGYWSEQCDLVFTETNDRAAADIVIEDHDFGDGPGGVLADAQLPGPRQQLMRIGREGNFVASSNPPSGTTDIVAIICHESGHIIGFYHLPSGGDLDLMEAFYRAGLRKPQRAESAMARQWYGAPVARAPPSDPTKPTGKVIIEVTAIVDGVEYVAKGEAKRK